MPRTRGAAATPTANPSAATQPHSTASIIITESDASANPEIACAAETEKKSAKTPAKTKESVKNGALEPLASVAKVSPSRVPISAVSSKLPQPKKTAPDAFEATTAKKNYVDVKGRIASNAPSKPATASSSAKPAISARTDSGLSKINKSVGVATAPVKVGFKPEKDVVVKEAAKKSGSSVNNIKKPLAKIVVAANSEFKKEGVILTKKPSAIDVKNPAIVDNLKKNHDQKKYSGIVESHVKKQSSVVDLKKSAVAPTLKPRISAPSLNANMILKAENERLKKDNLSLKKQIEEMTLQLQTLTLPSINACELTPAHTYMRLPTSETTPLLEESTKNETLVGEPVIEDITETHTAVDQDIVEPVLEETYENDFEMQDLNCGGGEKVQNGGGEDCDVACEGGDAQMVESGQDNSTVEEKSRQTVRGGSRRGRKAKSGFDASKEAVALSCEVIKENAEVAAKAAEAVEIESARTLRSRRGKI